VFPVWAAWNWATFLRYPDIPSEWVLFAHGPYWKVDASGDAVLVFTGTTVGHGRAWLGIPGMKTARKLIRDYYLGAQK